MKRTYRGSCHCGRARFEVDADLDHVRVCDCSICRRRGALLHRVDDDDLRLLTPIEELTVYQWNTRTAKDYFCPDCGILPFRRPRTAPEKWSVNVRCLPEVDLGAIPIEYVHGSKLDVVDEDAMHAMFRARLIFERQWLHASLLAVLLAGLTAISGLDRVRSGQLWGVSTPTWFWLAAALPVAHQVYVWFCWRTQLHASWLTRAFGTLAFPVYATGFSVLGLARVASVFVLAAANRGTLPGNPHVLELLALIVLVPAAYLFYSVQRYFGFKRAFGIDHFDESYRSLPFVRKGIFRFTRNGMYVFGFLLLWVPALWSASAAALCIALFNHLYIWVHYFATERPDMKRIYGQARA